MTEYWSSNLNKWKNRRCLCGLRNLWKNSSQLKMYLWCNAEYSFNTNIAFKKVKFHKCSYLGFLTKIFLFPPRLLIYFYNMVLMLMFKMQFFLPLYILQHIMVMNRYGKDCHPCSQMGNFTYSRFNKREKVMWPCGFSHTCIPNSFIWNNQFSALVEIAQEMLGLISWSSEIGFHW